MTAVNEDSALAADALTNADLPERWEDRIVALRDGLDSGTHAIYEVAKVEALQNLAVEAGNLFDDVRNHTDPRLEGVHNALKAIHEVEEGVGQFYNKAKVEALVAALLERDEWDASRGWPRSEKMVAALAAWEREP